MPRARGSTPTFPAPIAAFSSGRLREKIQHRRGRTERGEHLLRRRGVGAEADMGWMPKTLHALVARDVRPLWVSLSTRTGKSAGGSRLFPPARPQHASNWKNAGEPQEFQYFRVAAPIRFERTTFPLGGGRSIQLSYGARCGFGGLRLRRSWPAQGGQCMAAWPQCLTRRGFSHGWQGRGDSAMRARARSRSGLMDGCGAGSRAARGYDGRHRLPAATGYATPRAATGNGTSPGRPGRGRGSQFPS